MTTKILIIDDDKYTRQVLGKILVRDKTTARLDPEIIEAADGVSGVAKFIEHRPRLAIVDLFIPKMDGFAVCKKLRESAPPEELTIAVTSGVYKDPSIAAKLEADFEARFFAKPYQLKSIATFVAEALGATGRRSPAGDETSAIAKTGTLSANETAARLFWDLMEEEATGRLVLRKGQVVRQIVLFVGHPVKVTTNVREETLGNFLVMRGRIDREIQCKGMALAASTKKRLGEAFIEMGVLTPQSLIKELTAQTRYKLSNALRWAEGDWSFREGQPKNSRSNALDFAEVIVNGLAAGTRVQSPDREIAALAQAPLTLNERGEALLRQIAISVSPEFAKSFQTDITMEEIRSTGVTRAHLFRSLDVLSTCGGLIAGSRNAVPTGVSGDESEGINLKDLAAQRDGGGAGEDLYAGLFDSGSPVATNTGSNPARAAWLTTALELPDRATPRGWERPHRNCGYHRECTNLSGGSAGQRRRSGLRRR
ncbi:MAG: response regulator [Myxococcales bacterium]|nr:response regulator [Myxococcales bacterium]